MGFILGFFWGFLVFRVKVFKGFLVFIDLSSS